MIKKNKPGNLVRYEGNPILAGDDFPEPIHSIYNSGITRYKDAYIMICRVEDRAMRQHLWLARSKDGFKFVPDSTPFVLPDDSVYQQAIAGTYFDPRVTLIDDTYYIVHAAADAKFNPRLGMIRTSDFEKFEFVSFPGSVNTRNGILFPERINGRYVLLERDAGLNGGEMWISYSPDLVYWGQAELLYSRTAEYWHYCKVGGGAVPIKTEKGWLNIFHGVQTVCQSQMIYRLGVMLLDLENPTKIIASCPYYILSPEEDYERNGLTPNVVFTCGAWAEDDGEVKLYYGGADTVQCVATTTIEDLLEACFLNRKAVL